MPLRGDVSDPSITDVVIVATPSMPPENVTGAARATFDDEAQTQELLMKLGAARAKAPAAWRLIDVDVPAGGATFSYTLNRNKLRQARRREGRYLLRTNLCGQEPAELWQFYIQLTEIEAAFKTLKDDLGLRPIYHRLEQRIEAHIFVAFLAYCLHVTLRARLKPLAGGLTPRAVFDKFAAIQMLDVHFPTTDGRTLILCRTTELDADQKILARQLDLTLPPQPPPRITAARQNTEAEPVSAKLRSNQGREAAGGTGNFLRFAPRTATFPIATPARQT